MPKKTEIAFNTIYQLIAKFYSSSVTVIISIYITRSLGAEVFGEYIVVLTYVMAFMIFTDFGINAITAREFAKDHEIAKLNFVKLVVLRLLLGLVIIFVALISLNVFGYSNLINTAIILISPILLLNSVYKASEVIFLAYKRYKYHAFSILLGYTTILLFYLYFLIFSDNIEFYQLFIPYLIGYFVMMCFSLYFVREFVNVKNSPIDIKYWTKTLKIAFPLGSSLVLNALMVQADRLILSILSVPLSVGYYALAYRLFEFVLVLPTFYMNSIYNDLLKNKQSSAQDYGQLFVSSIKLLTLLALILTILIIPMGIVMIPIIWGTDMSETVKPFIVLMIGSVIFFVTSPLSWFAVVENKQRILPQIYGIVFIVNILLNVIFIPKYDYMASAIITVLSELIVLTLLIILLRKELINIHHRHDK